MRKRLLSCLCLLAAAAPLAAGNLLQNRSFDTDLSGWSAPFDSNAVWSSTGRASAGSALVVSRYVQGNAVLDAGIFQCVAVSAGHAYAFGGSLFVPGAAAADQQIVTGMDVAWYSDASCGSGYIQDVVYAVPVIRDTWVDVQRSAAAPAGAHSAKLALFADGSFSSPTADPIQVFIDDAYFYSDQTCANSAGNLCFGDRFRVYGDWAVPSQDKRGYMQARPATADSGLFWFFEADNLEMFVKVLNACSNPFNHYWVFASGLTNVQVTLHVDDTVSGQTREYDNPADTPFAPVQDTSAFATCP
jgi:hypothetical protein